jgi:hypothetical protein
MITEQKIKIWENNEIEDVLLVEEANQYIKDAVLVGTRIISVREGSELAIQNWQFSGVFSATNYRVVAWATGTLKLMNGQSYTISAGNTGNMTAVTYIYFDLAVSKTTLQVTTTAATAVGTNKILIAVAQNNSDITSDATFQVFGGTGGILIKADNIAANTVTANEIAANTITANKLNITQLSAITADMGALTTGTITLDSAGHIKGGQTAYNTGTGFFLGYSTDAYKFSIGNPAGSYLTWDGSALTVNGALVAGVGSSIAVAYLSGTLAQANLNVADRGWSQTCAFSVTDADTIAWGAGTFTSADGTAYSIGAGNTGNMSAKTYIYLDVAVSLTAYQTTTTATTAVGAGKVLIAIAQNGTTEATYKVMQGQGGENIDAANIVAGSITANEIAASTITAGKLSVTTLSSIVANLGSITAGNITLDSSGYIKGGQTAYNTGTGFFLGYDTSAYKLSLGSPTGDRMLWDGSGLTIVGKVSITGMSATAGENLTAGQAVYLKASDSKLYKAIATTNDEAIHSYKGIVIANANAAATANLYTNGIISGFNFDFTDTIAETIDWSETRVSEYENGLSVLDSEDGTIGRALFVTGNYVANITKIDIAIYSIQFGGGGTADSITASVYASDADGHQTGSSLGAKTITSGIDTSGWKTITFDTPIVLEPRTPYVIVLDGTTTGSRYLGWVWAHTGTNATPLTKTGSMGFNHGTQKWNSGISFTLTTYYTVTKYCAIGDNVYITDSAGGIDYIPGTYQKAIGTIFSATEILLPYETEKLICKRGLNYNDTDYPYAGGAVSVPVNARKAIIQFNSGTDPWAGEMTLINPIKMSGTVAGDINDSNVSVAATWSGNYISFTTPSTGYVYITFLT